MTDKTPEALALAGKLYDNGDVPSLEECSQAAALLRHQHQRIEELEKALRDAATSLETISRTAGTIEGYLDTMPNVRGYAGSRARVARALLSTTRQEGSQS